MNCGYGEKLILYFYGEAGPELKAGVESHLKTCVSCRAELDALAAAENWLKAEAAPPAATAVEAVMSFARAAAVNTGLSCLNRAQVLFAGTLAAVMAVLFAFPFGGESSKLLWSNGLDSGLDSVEYSISQAQYEISAPQADWEYTYGLLEAESGGALG